MLRDPKCREGEKKIFELLCAYLNALFLSELPRHFQRTERLLRMAERFELSRVDCIYTLSVFVQKKKKYCIIKPKRMITIRFRILSFEIRFEYDGRLASNTYNRTLSIQLHIV